MPIVRSVRSAFHTAGVAAGALAVAAMLPLSAQAQNPPGDAPPSAAPEQASPTDDASVEVPYTEYVVVTATNPEHQNVSASMSDSHTITSLRPASPARLNTPACGPGT